MEGRPTLLIAPLWHRGRGRYENGAIHLDRATAEPYELHAEADVDLLNDLSNIHDSTDAIRFVRRYGLLETPADADEQSEPLAAFTSVAAMLRDLFRLYELLHRPALDSSERRDLEQTARRVYLWISDEPPPAFGDETEIERLEAFSGLLALAVNYGLGDARFRVISASDVKSPEGRRAGRPGSFVFGSVVSNPLQAAFVQLALAIGVRRQLRACEECGALFVVRDQRQRFHDARCANRNRQRRFKQKGDRSA